jgi:UDP-N-acetylglucosamine acyltransferase
MIYLRRMNVSQAVNVIEADMPATPERDEILAFIHRSTRGLMKGYSKFQKQE